MAALLLSPPLLSSVSPAILSSTATPIASFISPPSYCLTFRWCQNTSIGLNQKTGCWSRIGSSSANRRHCIVVRAANDDDQGPAPEVGDQKSGNEEPSVPIDKLPLESKLQMQLEQKLKMKLAKKIRLKRKRLVRKRRLRKKGRWPPSKLKKLRNQKPKWRKKHWVKKKPENVQDEAGKKD